jgi:hypothetical protein
MSPLPLPPLLPPPWLPPPLPLPSPLPLPPPFPWPTPPSPLPAWRWCLRWPEWRASPSGCTRLRLRSFSRRADPAAARVCFANSFRLSVFAALEPRRASCWWQVHIIRSGTHTYVSDCNPPAKKGTCTSSRPIASLRQCGQTRTLVATAAAQVSAYSTLSVRGHQSHTAKSPAFPGARLSLKRACIHAADGRLTVTRSALSHPTHAATAAAHAQCGLQMCPTVAGHTMRCRSA